MMRKFFIIVLTLILLITLSSCAINIFKNNPKVILKKLAKQIEEIKILQKMIMRSGYGKVSEHSTLT
ncbi:MAG: hypothetical protein ISS47_05975 [Candidatus Omnitrophica bacterium]|nr:hypothetical protein [Candidatus Omnitrophota bacterium]